MPTTTDYQGISIPVGTDNPDIPADIDVFANALEQRTIMRFANAAARDAAITSPVNGMHAWLTGTLILTYYNGTAWVTSGSNIKDFVVIATDSVHEGGDIILEGSASFKDWNIDLYDEMLRFRFDPTSFITVLTMEDDRVSLGAGISFYHGTLRQPTFYVSDDAPLNSQGANGDVWFEY